MYYMFGVTRVEGRTFASWPPVICVGGLHCVEPLRNVDGTIVRKNVKYV